MERALRRVGLLIAMVVVGSLIAGIAVLNREADRTADLQPLIDEPRSPPPAIEARAMGSGVQLVDQRPSALPMQPDSPGKFWGAADRLFDVYTAGIESADPAQAFLAREALNICLPYAMRKPFVDDAVVRNDGTAAAEVYRTRARLQHACRPFSNMPVPTLLRHQEEASARIRAAGLPVNPADAELSRSPTSQEIAKARDSLILTLQSHGPDAMIWLAPAIAGWIEHAASANPDGIDPALVDTRYLGAAVLLSQCLMGYDCGKDAVPYLLICSTNGHCGGSLDRSALVGLSETERDLVRHQAEAIARSIQEKRSSGIGLQQH